MENPRQVSHYEIPLATPAKLTEFAAKVLMLAYMGELVIGDATWFHHAAEYAHRKWFIKNTDIEVGSVVRFLVSEGHLKYTFASSLGLVTGVK